MQEEQETNQNGLKELRILILLNFQSSTLCFNIVLGYTAGVYLLVTEQLFPCLSISLFVPHFQKHHYNKREAPQFLLDSCLLNCLLGRDLVCLGTNRCTKIQQNSATVDGRDDRIFIAFVAKPLVEVGVRAKNDQKLIIPYNQYQLCLVANPRQRLRPKQCLGGFILPTPGEAKAKAMPGRLYIHTK